MTIALRPCRVRLSCNVDSHAAVVDALTTQAAITWRGVPVNVEFVIRVGTALITSITDTYGTIDKVYFSLLSNRSLAPLWTKELAASALAFTVTDATWLDGTAQHGTFALTAADMQVDMTAANNGQRVMFWVLHVVMASTGTPITVGTGQWTIEEDGAGNGLAVNPGENWNHRASPTTGLDQMRSSRTGYWHSLDLFDPGDGKPIQIVIDQTGEA